MSFHLAVIISFILGALLTWIVMKALHGNKYVPLEKYNQLQASAQQMQIDQASELARLKSELQYKNENLAQQKLEAENVGERLEMQFKNLAQKILDEKAEKFSVQQQHDLKTILEPLREQIKTFKNDYEAKQTKESEERISLREQVKHMMELNKNLSEQAENLTSALRGNVKLQGNWGEMILESILQYAGLQKGLQYFTQEQSRNGEGKIIQPDVIVRYPGEKNLVIDAKVSLVHYEAYCNASEKDMQRTALTALLKSFKSHIDGLGAKSYQDIGNTPDFVLMFVPVEAAYITAVQNEPSLWQYAYTKKIILISPTNLIAAMKLVADMWQQDSVDREAQRIAEKAGKLYDKLVLFVENLDRVGAQLSRAQESWQEAYKQLSTGKGNAISQAEDMKNFSGRNGKSLPPKLVEKAMLENSASAG